jgi:hypothetical protein
MKDMQDRLDRMSKEPKKETEPKKEE